MSNTDSLSQTAGTHELATLSAADHDVSEESLLPFATWEAEPRLPDPLDYYSLADDRSSFASTKQPFRCDAFATQEALGLWFPRVKETDTFRMRWSKRSRALGLQLGVALLVFVANLSLTIYALVHFGSRDGVGLLYAGDCDTVKQLDRWLHLLINVLSTVLLSASNYCMQLQAAPTRKELDEAHKRGDWMDIGILSLRNLRYISRDRQIIWALLALSSLPIHLAYNSAVFQSLGSNSYTIAVVKDSFLQGAPFNITFSEQNRAGDPGWDEIRVNPPIDYHAAIAAMQEAAGNGTYKELGIPDCVALYNDYFAPQGNAVILVQNQSVQSPDNGSLLLHVGIVPRSDNWAKNMWAIANGTGGFRAFGPPPTRSPLGSWALRAISPIILVTVCSLNLVKVGILFYTCASHWNPRWWRAIMKSLRPTEIPGNNDDGKRHRPLSTLGDAIASFMREPDETTKGMCLASRDDFVAHRRMRDSQQRYHALDHVRPRPFKFQGRHWMHSVSLWRRVFTLSLCLALLVVTVSLLVISFTSLRARHIRVSVPSFWGLGFGRLTPFTYLIVGLPRADPYGLIANVLLANLPQLLLSLTYVCYNATLSAFLVQRVSEPVGLQRSTYTISLPFRYGIPLYAASGLMHWLVSQSLFLARITALEDQHGTVNVRDSFSTCGYSPIAVLATVVAGMFQVLAVVLLGCRKYDGVMRMVSTNSQAISAACHPLEGDRGEGYLLPLRWGVVELREDGVGHCTFTTAPQEGHGVGGQGMRAPTAGSLYA
ncbi:hypothetical protein PG985_001826 [Apiospora marii]|uniref:DUF6536 domain-containing protein n=1 Tax=Apiospora marii TaxID=335849 RepID=A0ABR1S0X1_9PEZI